MSLQGYTVVSRLNLLHTLALLTPSRIGHYERKMKHLENQKESKKKMKRVGTIDLPQEAFYDILSSAKK